MPEAQRQLDAALQVACRSFSNAVRCMGSATCRLCQVVLNCVQLGSGMIVQGEVASLPKACFAGRDGGGCSGVIVIHVHRKEELSGAVVSCN